MIKSGYEHNSAIFITIFIVSEMTLQAIASNSGDVWHRDLGVARVR